MSSAPQALVPNWRIRRGPGSLYRKIRSLEYLATRDRGEVWRFLAARYPVPFSAAARLELVRRFVETTNAVRGYHTNREMLAVARQILALAGRPGLTVVEAGSGKGASTAKLSLAVRIAGGTLHVFDSFRGLPANDELDEHLDGRPARFRAGAFAGRLASVKRVVERFGAIEVCEFHKGWFHETLPRFERPVDVAILDVDLLSSTRICLARLFPLLRAGGLLFTQDGHLKKIVETLASERFWRDEVGVHPPAIPGLGERKFLEIRAASP
ncbi:MAG: class I SAM-dependent methyltransferase [Planctomycetes bacterium]|nr:class I SAM-dependent methyltransferase [Planctomycetota bacterium]